MNMEGYRADFTATFFQPLCSRLNNEQDSSYLQIIILRKLYLGNTSSWCAKLFTFNLVNPCIFPGFRLLVVCNERKSRTFKNELFYDTVKHKFFWTSLSKNDCFFLKERFFKTNLEKLIFYWIKKMLVNEQFDLKNDFTERTNEIDRKWAIILRTNEMGRSRTMDKRNEKKYERAISIYTRLVKLVPLFTRDILTSWILI